MCKKLVIAAVAILVGTAVVRHSSLVRVWYDDAKQALSRQVPLETKIRQLKVEIGDIDKKAREQVGKLAAQEAEKDRLEKQIASLKDAQTALQSDMTALIKSLDAKTERVSFKGHNYSANVLLAKLERNTAEFESRKRELKSLEQLLDTKAQMLETASNAISSIRDKKAELQAKVGQLESRLQSLRAAANTHTVDIDVGQDHIAVCHQMANDIDEQLTIAERTESNLQKFGFKEQTETKTEPAKPTTEILNAAKKALEPEAEQQRVAENNKQ
jgi:chromosome segregation ATPase